MRKLHLMFKKPVYNYRFMCKERFVMVAGKQACEATLRACRLCSWAGFANLKKAKP
jgi:hypothetical protein